MQSAWFNLCGISLTRAHNVRVEVISGEGEIRRRGKVVCNSTDGEKTALEQTDALAGLHRELIYYKDCI